MSTMSYFSGKASASWILGRRAVGFLLMEFLKGRNRMSYRWALAVYGNNVYNAFSTKIGK